MYRRNSTEDYHLNDLNSLGWELTVCNALYPAGTALRRLLGRDGSFGTLLFAYLSRLLPMEEVGRVIEIGGGYGYLMRDFLCHKADMEVTMVDISPYLLERQREAVGSGRASYRQEDFLETDTSLIAGFDLAIMNENLGDFPTLLDLEKDFSCFPRRGEDPDLDRADDLFRRYGLSLPGGEERTFNFNLGAIEALERLCQAGIPSIYLGEHSCEAQATGVYAPLMDLKPGGNPERIALRGHDEYSIKFSHLERVGEAFGYQGVRGPFADFVPVNLTDRLKFIISTRGRYGDEDEMIFQFVEDLFKYEYLILLK